MKVEVFRGDDLLNCGDDAPVQSDTIPATGVAEPDGILRKLESAVA